MMLLFAFICFCVNGFAGELNPTSGPAPSMKTLDEVEPRIPIHEKDLPLFITSPGSYYFAEDIYFKKDVLAAIVINTSNVTIDLCGFSLAGTKDCDYGIYCQELQNVRIHNGTIRTFKENGIHMPLHSHVVEDMRITDVSVGIYIGDKCRVNKCTVTCPEDLGIRCGKNAVISDCIVANYIKPECSTGIMCDENSNVFNCNVNYTVNKGIIVGSYSRVNGCSVSMASDVGIYSQSSSVVSDCAVYGCGIGIQAEYDGYLYNNNVSSCSNYGIKLGYNNTVKNNKIRCSQKGVYGLYHNMIISNVINHSTTAVEVSGTNFIEANIIKECSVGLNMTLNENFYLNNRIDTNVYDYQNESDDIDGGGNLLF
jgi:hypothetical protein